MELITSIFQGFIVAGVGIAIVGFLMLLMLVGMDENIRGLTIKASIFLLLLLLMVIFVPKVLKTNTSQLRNILPSIAQSLLGIGLLLLAIWLFIKIIPSIGNAVEEIISSMRNEVEDIIYNRTRRNYLQKLLISYNTQIINTSQVRYHEIFDNCPPSLQIVGAPGIGKSILLKRLLVSKVEQALNDTNSLLPIFLDANKVTAKQSPLKKDNSFNVILNGIGRGGKLVNWMLKRSLENNNIYYIIDSSDEKVELSPTSNPRKYEASDFLTEMLIRYQQCRFVIAASIKLVPDYTVGKTITLEPLSNLEIEKMLKDLMKDQDRGFFALLLTESSWLNLARNPFILSLLIQYYKNIGELPHDWVHLLHQTMYPKSVQSEDGDLVLSYLASRLALTKSSSVSVNEIMEINKTILTNSTPQEILNLFNQQGIVDIYKKGRNRQKWVNFTHSMYKPFFIAMGWRKGILITPNITHVDQISNDKLLSDAFILFINIEKDSIQFNNLLYELLNRNDNFSRLLVAKCVLAKPTDVWPLDLIEKITNILVNLLANYDDETTNRVWRLLENWDQMQRVKFYSNTLVSPDPGHTEALLLWLAKHAPEDLKAILWHDDTQLCDDAVGIMIQHDREQALVNFEELYYDVPQKRGLAIKAMGRFSREEVENLLLKLLQQEKEPDLREQILQSLVQSRSEPILTFFDIIANTSEADSVRICAAKYLSDSKSQELKNDRAIYELVRIAHTQMPREAMEHLDYLMVNLKETRGNLVAKWEKTINPYVAGRPVTEQLFFGRRKILDEIRSSIESGCNLILKGERRIGKTSILLQVAQQLLDDRNHGVPVFPIFIDMQTLKRGDEADSSESERDVYHLLISTIIDQVSFDETPIEPLQENIYGHRQFLRDIKRIVSKLKKSQGQRAKLVLFLDEADILATYPDLVLSRLRSTFNNPEIRNHLVTILAGVNPERKWKSNTSPFYNLFRQTIDIPPLSLPEAVELITMPVRDRFVYEEKAIQRIIEYSRGEPFNIQNICHQLLDYILACGQQQITDEIVHEICGKQYEESANLAKQAKGLIDIMIDWLEDNADKTTESANEKINMFINELRTMFLNQAMK